MAAKPEETYEEKQAHKDMAVKEVKKIRKLMVKPV